MGEFMSTLDKEAFSEELLSLCNRYGVIIESGLDFSIIVRATPYTTFLSLEPSFYRSNDDEDVSADEIYMWENL
jgi:hypothetical protein